MLGPSFCLQEYRFQIFRKNSNRMFTVSQNAPLADYVLDEHADRTAEEMGRSVSAATLGSWFRGPGVKVQAKFAEKDVRVAVEQGQLDWVARGAVTPPISQGRCGTCAQFSATANIEAQWFLHGHPLVALAVQEMIDCSSYTGPYGMGWVADIHHGLDKAEDYPLANHSDPTLKGCRSPCDVARSNKSFAHIDGATCTPQNTNETQMMAWLQHGPLSISIAAGPLNGYHGGIITGQACNDTHVDHAVLIVGYGTDNGTDYWKLKNSWGPAFGEGGYVRLQRGVHCLHMIGACQSYIGKPPSGI